MRSPFVGRRLLQTSVGLAAGLVIALLLVEGAVTLMGRLGTSGASAIAAAAPVQTSPAAPVWLESPPPFKALPFAPPSPVPTQPANPAPPAKAPGQNPQGGPQPSPHHKPHG